MYEDFIKGTADMEPRRDKEAHFSQEVNRAATRLSAATGDDYSDAESPREWERRPSDNGLDPTRAAFSEVSRSRRWRQQQRRGDARQSKSSFCRRSRRRQIIWVLNLSITLCKFRADR